MPDSDFFDVVELPAPELLTRFELLQLSPQLPLPAGPPRWARGITLQYPVMHKPTAVGAGCEPTHNNWTVADSDDGAIDSVSFPAFGFWEAAVCSTLGDIDGSRMLAVVDERFRRFTERLFDEQVFTASANGNVGGLNDRASVLTTVTNLADAIGALEVAFEAAYGNVKGMIHVPKRLFTSEATPANPWPTETARGHSVVSSSGYESTVMVPDGQGAGEYVFISPTIYHKIDQPLPIGSVDDIDYSRNLQARLKAMHGVFAFDPQAVFAVGVS